MRFLAVEANFINVLPDKKYCAGFVQLEGNTNQRIKRTMSPLKKRRDTDEFFEDDRWLGCSDSDVERHNGICLGSRWWLRSLSDGWWRSGSVSGSGQYSAN